MRIAQAHKIVPVMLERGCAKANEEISLLLLTQRVQRTPQRAVQCTVQRDKIMDALVERRFSEEISAHSPSLKQLAILYIKQ
jgi:hypothetical protein